MHFNFQGTYLKALWVFSVLPLSVPVIVGLVAGAYFFTSRATPEAPPPDFLNVALAVVVFYAILQLLIIPYISKQTNQYLANNLRFGTAQFSADMPIGALFRNLFEAALFIIFPFLFLLLVFAGESSHEILAGLFNGEAVLPLLALYLGTAVYFLFYAAGVRNIAFNATEIEGGHKLSSDVPRFGYAWVIISNLLASVFTIGLLIPWAAVRSWRYLVERTAIDTPGLEQFVADQEAQGNVVAAEYLDIDGIDFGL